MPPFRNPFNRRPANLSGLGPVNDENARPGSNGNAKALDGERPSYSGSRASSGISINKSVKEPDEFKMSVVNDSGVYLPPSPTEGRGFWRRTPTSTTTSSHRSMLSENEPFSISRESFDSYRRSFDISARSPISHPDSGYGRQSLDSYHSLSTPRTPKSAFSATAPHLKADAPASPRQPQVVDEEVFEDVGLGETNPNATNSGKVLPKKRGLFARLGDAATGNAGSANSTGESVPGLEERPGSSHNRFHLPSRKRGQSGQGAELRAMPRAGGQEGESVAVR